MNNTMDLTSHKFNKLTAIYRAPNIVADGKSISSWYCECDCGNTCIVSDNDLLENIVTSCGCDFSKAKKSSYIPKNNDKFIATNTVDNIEGVKPLKTKNLTGQRFGRLTVLPKCEIKIAGKKKQIKMPYWTCKCDCGNEVVVNGHNLLSGNTTSCGCIRLEALRASLKELAAERAANPTPKPVVLNEYSLSSKYGIGYCVNDKSEFYFDLEDYDRIKEHSWVKCGNYIVTHIDGAMIRLSQFIKPAPAGLKTAYIHGLPSAHDNRKSNLRFVDWYQINWNKRVRTNNTSGVTGVCYSNTNKSWKAYLNYRGKHLIKYCSSKQEAINQRKAWEEEYYGEYSYDNSQAL